MGNWLDRGLSREDEFFLVQFFRLAPVEVCDIVIAYAVHIPQSQNVGATPHLRGTADESNCSPARISTNRA